MALRLLAAIGAAMVVFTSGCGTLPPEPTAQPRPSISPAPTTTADTAAAIQADLLFGSPQHCDLSLADHIVVSIAFPRTWSTNDAIEGNPACLWFGPDLPQPTADTSAEGAMITYGTVGGPATFSYQWISREETTVAGRPAWRVEESVPSPTNPDQEMLQLVYWVSLGSDPADGPTLVARTSAVNAGNYALNKAVLDRMMARLAIN